MNIEFEMLKNHVGHNLKCVMYGGQNVSIECTDCNEVLYSVDIDIDEEGEKND